MPRCAGMRFVFACLLVACTSDHVFDLDELPVEDWTGGLPVEGEGRMHVWVARPADDWTKATGYVRFHCEACRLGDGVAKMKVPGFEEGLTFPGIELGTVDAMLHFAKGKLTMTTTWRSGDFVLDAKIVGKLAPRADDIELVGCVRFGPTGALRERDPRMHAIVVTTGAPMVDDTSFAIAIEGTLGAMRRLGRVCSLAQVR